MSKGLLHYKVTTEDWCPNYENNTVIVKFIDNANNESSPTNLNRVVVSGNDDIMMSIDDDNALEIFYEIIDSEDPITFKKLKDLGFNSY